MKRDLSPKQRRLLELMLSEKRRQQQTREQSPEETRPRKASIPLRDASEKLLLSFAQQRLWFIEQFQPGTAAYNIPSGVRLRGPLDVRLFEHSLRLSAGRHETLRTTFALTGGQPVQVISPEPEATMPLVDLRSLPRRRVEAEAQKVVDKEARRPFAMAQAPPWRALLVRLAGEEHIFLAVMHHIISDTWTTGVFFREMVGHYKALAEGQAARVPEITVQYADYALWQRRELQGGGLLEPQLAYWIERFAGAPALLDLPIDRPRPAVPSFRGGRITLLLPNSLTDRLKALSSGREASFFMLLMAGYQALLHRYTGETDILVGTPMANRNRVELENLIGLFVNTLVLRTDFTGHPTFLHLLDQVRETTLEGLSHHDVPFERVVEELNLERDTSRNPLFQVLFAFQNVPIPKLVAEGLSLERYEFRESTARLDLELDLQEMPYGFVGWLGYNSDLFEPTTVGRMAANLRLLFAAIAENPDRPVRQLPLLGAAERHQVLWGANDTRADYPHDASLERLFELQVKRAPDALAVDDGTSRWTYGELDAHANQLAHLLLSLGVGRGSPVGVYLHRDVGCLAALLGILKAGGTYVPMELGWPVDRLEVILRSAGISHLVTTSSCLEAIEEISACLRDVVCLDAPVAGTLRPRLWGRPQLAEQATLRPAIDPCPEAFAYVIFTSGSTGVPKGVMVRHRPVVNLINWLNPSFGVGTGDRVLCVASLSFDLSVYDVFGILAAGGSIRLAADAEVRDPQALVSILTSEPITFWDSAPAALQQLAPFLPAAPLVDSPLRLVFLSGDWIPVGLPDQVRRAFPGARLISLGGATEATVWSNFFPVDEVAAWWSSIPYGRPIDNAQYYVLDDELAPQPIGAAGDLFIGGECLASGYLGSPALSAGKFVPDPYGGASGARLYRTGDRARFWSDGNLEFLGRRDHQVKIRGYRIELGEIATILSQHPEVRDSAVVAREDVPGDQRLVAYVVAENGEGPTIGELRAFLQRKLPDYMVPTAFVTLDELPVTANGKLDRQALPAPSGDRPLLDSEFVEAKSETERRLAEMWKQVLQVDRVGRNDNFFELGGHSLLLTQIHQELQQTMAPELTLVDLFSYPTIASLAEHLSHAQASSTAVRTSLERAAARRSGLARETDIAIIGMALRFPRANTPEEFWDNLRHGVECIDFFSREEVIAAGVAPEVADHPDYVRAEGTVANADMFDPKFFGYTNQAEVELLDPQQRIFMECAWEALERAGYDPQVWGERIGIFGGVNISSYLFNALYDYDPVNVMSTFLTRIGLLVGNQNDYLCTRVAYHFDLKGPSVTVQTACSTATVAAHLACQSLMRHECDICLAGGVQIRVPQNMGYMYQEGGFPSPDGHCRSFDAKAKGNVHGNGAGVLVLKRLSDAVHDRDHIHAVIKGSAACNDGSVKVGFTAPGVDGQARAVAEALGLAGVEPESIGYLEATGTATELGDPIEIEALTRAFRLGTQKTGFCPIGSVKSNIGHTDAASGAAAVIKAALALEREEIPPSLHFEEPNPRIDFAASPFYVNTTLRPWTRGEGPRRAGVHTYAVGGTNTHVILEEAPPVGPPAPSRPWQLLPLTARTAPALETATSNLREYLERHGDLHLPDVAYTLQVGRRHFDHRRFVLCRDRSDALGALAGQAPSGETPGGELAVTFLLPGDDLPEAAVAVELYREEPTFRREVDACAELLRGAPELDLRDFFDRQRHAARWRQEPFAAAAIFAFDYALSRLWIEWGLAPRALYGQGVGELVAACLAGALDLDRALSLAVRGASGRTALAQTAIQPPRIPWMSSVTGTWVEPGDWRSQEQETPLAAVFGELTADPWRALLEVGPGERLCSAARQVSGEPRPILASLAESASVDSATARLLACLGRLWQAGAAVDWNGLSRHEERRRIPLPTYPFERVRIWAQPKADRQEVFQRSSEARAKTDLERWFYAPSWHRSEQPATFSAPRADEPRWLVLADAEGLGDALAESLRQAGGDAVTVRAGEAFAQLGEKEYAIRPAAADDHRRLVQELREAGLCPEEVVHLWGVGGDEGEPSPIFGKASELGFWSVVHLGRTLAEGAEAGNEPARFTVISQGVEEVTGDEELVPGRATVLAPLQVLPQELPSLACRHVDVVLPAAGSRARSKLVEALLEELRRSPSEPRVALRGRHRWVQRFERLELAPPAGDVPARLRPQGVYLIVGGTEGFGLWVAEFLARTVRAKLVLVGESGLPESASWDTWVASHDPDDVICRKIARLRQLEELGSELLLIDVDPANAAPMKAAIDLAEERFGALHGVFHAAAEQAPELARSLAELDADFYQYRLRSRLGSVSVLAELLRDRDLDFHLLTSTLGAIVSGPLAVVDCAADAFLDAFARRQNQLGDGSWTSVDWDRVALDPESSPLAITEREGTEVLSRILAAGELPQVAVSTVDLVARIERERRLATATEEEAVEVKPRADLATPYVAPRNEAEERMGEIWAGVLGLREVGVDDNFFDLGGNSLIATQLVSRIRESFQVDLALKDFFDDANVARVTELVEVGRWAREARTEAGEAVLAAVAEEEIGEI